MELFEKRLCHHTEIQGNCLDHQVLMLWEEPGMMDMIQLVMKKELGDE